jgi:excisionase family DNA binding protein
LRRCVVDTRVAKEYFWLPEIPLYYSISRSAVYVLINSGELPFSKVGRRRLIAKKDIDALMERYSTRSQTLPQQTTEGDDEVPEDE